MLFMVALFACQSEERAAPADPLPATQALAVTGSLPRSGEACTARVTIVDASGHLAVATFRFWRQAEADVWNWCVNCDASLAQTCEGGVEFTSGEIGTLHFDATGTLIDFRQSDGSGVLSAHFDVDPWRVCLIEIDAAGALGFDALVQSGMASVTVHAIP